MTEKHSDVRKAVALQYDPEQDHAPRVTAVGEHKMAEQIIALARINGIPIHQDPYLAGALADVSVSQQIPPELYSLVAEILAYLYRVHQSKGPR